MTNETASNGTATYETVLHEVSATGVHTLTLNRPRQMNAINEQLIRDCLAVMDEVSHDPQATVLVVAGAGRGFCAGADVDMMDATLDKDAAGETEWGSDEIRQKLRLRFQRLTQALYRVPVPTIALVRGAAVGGGLDLTCACDLVVASPLARFMVAYTRRGLFPDLGGFWLLPHVIGYRRAAEMVYTGRFVDATEAAAYGLVNILVDDEVVAARAEELAAEIATRPPIALRLGKLLMQRTASMEFETALEMGAMGTTITETSADFREAVTAFLDKREPRFRGR
jgi:enoyl-CoA hydratase/carnithine racemase